MGPKCKYFPNIYPIFWILIELPLLLYNVQKKDDLDVFPKYKLFLTVTISMQCIGKIINYPPELSLWLPHNLQQAGPKPYVLRILGLKGFPLTPGKKRPTILLHLRLYFKYSFFFRRVHPCAGARPGTHPARCELCSRPHKPKVTSLKASCNPRKHHYHHHHHHCYHHIHHCHYYLFIPLKYHR